MNQNKSIFYQVSSSWPQSERPKQQRCTGNFNWKFFPTIRINPSNLLSVLYSSY